jgi:hypothetical protein
VGVTAGLGDAPAVAVAVAAAGGLGGEVVCVAARTVEISRSEVGAGWKAGAAQAAASRKRRNPGEVRMK